MELKKIKQEAKDVLLPDQLLIFVQLDFLYQQIQEIDYFLIYIQMKDYHKLTTREE